MLTGWMRHRAFAISAALSLVLSAVAGAALAVCYYQPWSAIVYRGGDARLPTAPTPQSYNSALVFENRAGRVVLLYQWITLQRLPGDPPQTYPDVGRPREGRIVAHKPFVLLPGQSASYGNDWNRSVPDPLKNRGSDTLGILLHPAGFAYGQYEPGPVRLVASFRDGFHELETVLVAGNPPSWRRGFTDYSGHDYVGYRQLMLPHWLFGLLGLPLPLLWLRAHRRSRRWARRGLCPGCGYDVRESPERCPECGRAVPAAA